MGMRTNESFLMARSGEPRTRTALLLESITLRHQIAVLERSRTRRPCFRLWDRLFWILFSRWSPQWCDSLVIAQPGYCLNLALSVLISKCECLNLSGPLIEARIVARDTFAHPTVCVLNSSHSFSGTGSV